MHATPRHFPEEEEEEAALITLALWSYTQLLRPPASRAPLAGVADITLAVGAREIGLRGQADCLASLAWQCTTFQLLFNILFYLI